VATPNDALKRDEDDEQCETRVRLCLLRESPAAEV
jgi:hypothetical protein